MKRLFLAAVLVSLASVSMAQSGYWRDAQGAPIAETESRASKDGFAGWLLVTPDEDWKEKWETPSSAVPNFNEAKIVERGKRLFVLTFFANPALTNDRQADVTCDLKVTRPDGSASVDVRNAPCFQGKLAGPPENLYLSGPVLVFVGEPTDQSGTWKVHIVLKDNVRKTVLPLSTSFGLR